MLFFKSFVIITENAPDLVENKNKVWYTCCSIKMRKVINVTIDFHVHAFSEKIADKAISVLEQRAGIQPLTRGTTAQTLERMQQWGIDSSVILPIATKPSQQTVINNWAKQIDSERFISFGSVHPDAEDALDELERIRQLGLHGIKLHPDYQGFMIDDPKLDPLLDAIAQTGLPVIFHAGFDVVSPDLVHCAPQAALKMFTKHRGLKVILAHLGGNDRWDEVYETLAGVDGELYFDTAFTSWNCPDEMMQKIIDRHGADRILFASDLPWDSPDRIRQRILRLKLSDDAKEKILGANAQRLLGLT